MRRSEEETIRAVMEWKPEGKRPQDRPGKRWIDVIKVNLNALGV